MRQSVITSKGRLGRTKLGTTPTRRSGTGRRDACTLIGGGVEAIGGGKRSLVPRSIGKKCPSKLGLAKRAA